jgi:hypothetical protein
MGSSPPKNSTWNEWTFIANTNTLHLSQTGPVQIISNKITPITSVLNSFAPIPKTKLPAYINQAALKDGFVFLKTWLADNSPSSAYHKLNCIMKFANFIAGETPGQTLLADARGLLAALMSENQIITNRHYYAHFSLFLCAPQNSADRHS